MNPIAIVLGVIMLAFLAFGFFVLAPLFNKIFRLVWAEEDERTEVRKDTRERLDELFMDGDVPEETAVLMTSVEDNMEEKQLLDSFSAVNPKDLKKILASDRSTVMKVLGTLDSMSRKGMKRR